MGCEACCWRKHFAARPRQFWFSCLEVSHLALGSARSGLLGVCFALLRMSDSDWCHRICGSRRGQMQCRGCALRPRISTANSARSSAQFIGLGRGSGLTCLNAVGALLQSTRPTILGLVQTISTLLTIYIVQTTLTVSTTNATPTSTARSTSPPRWFLCSLVG